MPCHALTELGNVVVSLLAGVIRIVQRHAPVQAEDKKVQIVAQPDARAQGNLLREVLQLQLSAGTVLVGTHQPHVARIEEDGTMQVAQDAETVLHVCLHTDVAHMVDVGVLTLLVGRITAGTDATCGIGTDTVGTSDIECSV